MQRADVAFEVARIYEAHLLARDAERFFDEMLHWMNSTLEATQEKLAADAANVSERDVLRLQSARALAEMGLQEARTGMIQSRAGLAAYLGLPEGEEIVVAEQELLPVGPLVEDYPSLVALARNNRPEIAALDAGGKALDALAKAEWAGMLPDFVAMAFVSAAYTPGRDWIQTRFVVDPLNHFVPGVLLGLRWQFQGETPNRARSGTDRAGGGVATHRRMGRRGHSRRRSPLL